MAIAVNPYEIHLTDDTNRNLIDTLSDCLFIADKLKKTVVCSYRNLIVLYVKDGADIKTLEKIYKKVYIQSLNSKAAA